MLSSPRSWGALMLGGGARADMLCYVMLCAGRAVGDTLGSRPYKLYPVDPQTTLAFGSHSFFAPHAVDSVLSRSLARPGKLCTVGHGAQASGRSLPMTSSSPEDGAATMASDPDQSAGLPALPSMLEPHHHQQALRGTGAACRVRPRRGGVCTA